jgi:hypothetical protein
MMLWPVFPALLLYASRSRSSAVHRQDVRLHSRQHLAREYDHAKLELPRFSEHMSAWVTSGYPQAARGALLSQPSAQAATP